MDEFFEEPSPQCVSAVRSMRIMAPRLVPQFIRTIRLVLAGLRDGYMAEGFACDARDLARALGAICGDMGITDSARLSIVVLESGDLVVVNTDIFMQKLKSDGYYSPVVVNVEGIAPRVLSGDIRSQMLTELSFQLQKAIDTLGATSRNESTAVIHMPEVPGVGLVMLAGWLLGFPYLYHYTPVSTDVSSLGCAALAMQPLQKHSITTACRDGAEVPVQEFSVPLSCIAPAPAPTSRLLLSLRDGSTIADPSEKSSFVSDMIDDSGIISAHLLRLSNQSKTPLTVFSHRTEICTLAHVVL